MKTTALQLLQNWCVVLILVESPSSSENSVTVTKQLSLLSAYSESSSRRHRVNQHAIELSQFMRVSVPMSVSVSVSTQQEAGCRNREVGTESNGTRRDASYIQVC